MILINNEAIFVHVPRTAGSFIRQVFKESKIKHNSLNNTHGSILKLNSENRYAFGFVRNPWAWHVSIFLQFGGNPDGNEHAFKQYLKQNHDVNSLQRKYYEQFYHGGGLGVEVFKTEELEQSLNYVFEKFNWEKPQLLLDMTLINTKLQDKKKTYHEYYDEKTKDLVYQYNKDIIEIYDYKF